MKRADVQKRVTRILVEQLGAKFGEVKLETVVTTDLGADSIDLIEIVMMVEDEFTIDISDSDAEKLKTVGECVDYICDALNITK